MRYLTCAGFALAAIFFGLARQSALAAVDVAISAMWLVLAERR